MAIDLINSYQVAENGHWLGTWYRVVAGEDFIQVKFDNSLIDEAGYHPSYLLLDGVTMYWLDADADVGRVMDMRILQPGDAKQYLEALTTVGAYTTHHIRCDGLRLKPADQYGYLFYVDLHSVAAEANDALYVSAWGRYDRGAFVAPSVQPVSVEEMKVWPWARR